MSGAAVVIAIVLFIFFAIGITVGFVVVIALSARRATGQSAKTAGHRHLGAGGRICRKPDRTTKSRKNLVGGTIAIAVEIKTAGAGAGRGLVARQF